MKKFSELIKGQDCLFRYRAYKEETLNALEKIEYIFLDQVILMIHMII